MENKMEITLAICDDDQTEREYLQHLVKDWTTSRDLACQLVLYPNAEAFLFASEEILTDIVLLDIKMGEMDGVTLAKQLRQKDDRIQIAFITGLPDFIADGYEVAALHYLMKPVSYEKLADVLDRAVKRLDTEETMIVLPTKDGKLRLPINAISYVEAFSHDLCIYTNQGTISTKMTMNELEKMLGEGFFRCHRSYLTNMRHVRKITRNSFEMKDGSVLPLSRRLASKAMEVFLENH
jgi:DNA-binding LytR/AlgR family response regulator